MPSDLNAKKSWHPSLAKNQARVHQKEQEALAERRRIQERQQEIAKEREIDELRALQGKAPASRLSWMYEHVSGSQQEPQEVGEQEAQEAPNPRRGSPGGRDDGGGEPADGPPSTAGSAQPRPAHTYRHTSKLGTGPPKRLDSRAVARKAAADPMAQLLGGGVPKRSPGGRGAVSGPGPRHAGITKATEARGQSKGYVRPSR